MASIRFSLLSLLAVMALILGHAPIAALSGEALSEDAADQSESQDAEASERGLQSRSPGAVRSSAAEIGITSMMQMLRDEGIDIDARIARARADCRRSVTAGAAAGTSAEDIAQATEDCAIVEEGVLYARAINEMNSNRVNSFNDAMARHNAEVAEAERQKREYEQGLERHNAEVAAIERQQREYQRELEEHEALLASFPESSRNQAVQRSRSIEIAENTAPEADGDETTAPVQTASVSETTPPPPAAAPETKNASLAVNTRPQARPQARQTQPSSKSSGSLQRSQGQLQQPGPRAPGRILSQEESVELAIMEATGPRIALVIGNEEYAGSMGALSNPVNDAVLIGATLRSVGFDVEILTDASQREMKEAVQRLGDRLLDAGENATGLFFYAGHGVQSKGDNYLIPVGSVIDAESDLELEAVSADAILGQMEEAYVSTRIVILDACRNMPLRRRTRDGSRGLARMETPNGSFVAYSTSPGNTAADGGGIHSPFAEALASQMLVPNRPIEVTFREVRRQVVELTNGQQVPWDSSSLLETFSFAETR